MKKMGWLCLTAFVFLSCSTLFKDYEVAELKTIKEYDDAITVETFPEPSKVVEGEDPKSVSTPKPEPVKAAAKTPGKETRKAVTSKDAVSHKKPRVVKKTPGTEGKKSSSSSKSVKADIAEVVSAGKNQNSGAVKGQKLEANKKDVGGARVPELEDAEGFTGRRPDVDPFRVGEKITYKVSYFAVEAGRFDLSVLPYKQVNGRKAYHFHYRLKTSSLFSMFYAVDDVAETFVDYELWRPINYEIHVKESKQVKETKSYFDWTRKRGFLFEKKKVPNQAVENLKREWDILDWSQNVFSVGYYLRAFTLKVGKTLRVRVAHEGKNLIMSAKVLKKEYLDTPAGRFHTFVIRPTFKVDGIFKPTGDNRIWVSADERKFILRIESKIKIGTIVSMVDTLKKQ